MIRSNDAEHGSILLVLAIASGFAAIAALPACVRSLWRLLWHGPAASSMRQVGKAVLRAMIQAKLIETDFARLRVVARRLDYGLVGCSLTGGSTRERSVFLDAVQELFGPVEDPRYILVRKSSRSWFARKDYHSVPQILGKNKETAEHFRKMWSLRVGPADLVYTRTPEGRRFLLNARARSMAGGIPRLAERCKTWQ